MTKTETIYAKFETLEDQVAHCYFLFHERFVGNERLAKFWLETGVHEVQHAAMLRFCRQQGMMVDTVIHPRIIREVEDLLETVKDIARDPEVSIDEAFFASLLIERSELEDVYEKLTGILEKDHRLLFAAIRSNLHEHHVAFAEAAKKFVGSPRLIELFSRLAQPALPTN